MLPPGNGDKSLSAKMHSRSTAFIQPLLAPLVLMSTLGKPLTVPGTLVEKNLNNRKHDKKEVVAISVTFEAQKPGRANRNFLIQFIFILLNIYIQYP